MFRNHDFINRFICSIGPEGGSSGTSSSPGGGSGGGGGSSSSAAPAGGGSTSSQTSTPSPAPSPSGSPSATPSSPSSSPSSEPTSAPSGDGFDYSAIFEGPADPFVPTQPQSPAPQAQPTAPAVPPQAPQAVPAQAQQTPEVAPQVPPTPAPTQPTSTDGAPGALPVLDPSDPASISAHLDKNRDALIAHLAATTFALSPEDVEALETDTVGTVPKLLARTFVQAQSSIMSTMARMIPQMVAKTTEAMRKNQESEDLFFSQWPSIPRSALDTVRKYAMTYRQMHPADTREVMFANLGPMLHMQLKIPMGAHQPAAPAAPQRQQPFVPAAGGAPAAIPHQAELDPVSALFAHQD